VARIASRRLPRRLVRLGGGIATAALSMGLSVAAGAVWPQVAQAIPGLGGERPAQVAESARPLGTPPATLVTDAPHAFMATQRDGVTPVAYDPCRPIHYVVNDAFAPAGSEGLVDAAVARISAATGLQFTYDGRTYELPSDEREPFQPERYGNRWAPVLIAWSGPGADAQLADDVSGRGGSTTAVADGVVAYVTGAVRLDAAQLGRVLASAGGQAMTQGVIEHELGHVVGLAHVDDATQLMFPATQQGVSDFAAGDLAGLAALGRGTCLPSL
jgi:hypothetical protein